MLLKLIKTIHDECIFKCNFSREFSTSIRRICIAETPIVSFDQCKFLQNDSAEPDLIFAASSSCTAAGGVLTTKSKDLST